MTLNNMFISYKNSWLRVENTIALNSTLDCAIHGLDAYFEAAKAVRYVTSAIRTPQEQLRIIIELARKTGITALFSDTDMRTKTNNDYYIWQPVWSELLAQGFLVNPPIAAEVLSDYVRDGVNKKGCIIKESPHFYGRAFDINGANKNTSGGIETCVQVLESARPAWPDFLVKSYQVEKQNCVHVNTAGI